MTASFWSESTTLFHATTVQLGDACAHSGTIGVLTLGTIDSRDYSGCVRSTDQFTDVECIMSFGDGIGTATRAGVGVRVDITTGIGIHLRPVTPHEHDGAWEIIDYTDDDPESYTVLDTFTPADISAADAIVTCHLSVVGDKVRAKVYETGDTEPAWGLNPNCGFGVTSIAGAGHLTYDAWGLAVDFTDQTSDAQVKVIQWDRVIGRSVLTSNGVASGTDQSSISQTTNTIIRKNRPCLILVGNTKASAPDTPDTPTLTGLTVGAALESLPWDTNASPTKRLTAFPAMAAADIASGGTLAVGFSGVNQTGLILEMIEFDGGHAVDSDGSDAFPNVTSGVRDTVNTTSPALSQSFTNDYATSGTVLGVAVEANGTQDPNGALNEVADLSHGTPAHGMVLCWDDANDTTPDTTTPNERSGAISAEVRRNDPDTHYGAFPDLGGDTDGVYAGMAVI